MRGDARQGFEILQARPPDGQGAETLAAVHAPAFGRQLPVGLAKQGIVLAHIQRHIAAGRLGRALSLGAEGIPHDAPGLPGLDPVLARQGQLLGKARGVGRGREGREGQDGRGGVVAVGQAPLRGKTRDDHIGTHPANRPDHIGQDRVVAPEPQRLFRRFGKAEIHGPGEILFGPIQAPGGQQFLGAQGRKRIALLGADEILATAPSGHGEVGAPQMPPPGEGGQGRRVLVIGVGRHIEHRAQDLQLVQDLLQVRSVPGRFRGLGS